MASGCSRARCGPCCSIGSTRSLGKHPDTATQRDIYDALSLAVREELAARWLATQRRVSQAGREARLLPVGRVPARPHAGQRPVQPRRRAGAGGPRSAGRTRLRPRSRRAGGDRSRPRQWRPRPPRRLLPRLARDAAVSRRRLRHPLRLRHLHAGHRRGRPAARDRDSWLRQRNPWEIPRDDARYVVRFGGRCVATPTRRARPLPLGRHARTSGPWASTC